MRVPLLRSSCLLPLLIASSALAVTMVSVPLIGRAQTVVTNIIPDATLGTVVDSSGAPEGRTTVTITGGTRPGNGPTVFYSFADFNLSRGDIALFDSASASGIVNAIIRVTGGNPSVIEGSLKAPSGVNLIFLNPNGLSVDQLSPYGISGYFVGSTASELHFADGSLFSMTTPAIALSATAIASLGFLDPAGSPTVLADIDAGGALDFEGGAISLVDTSVFSKQRIGVHATSLSLERSNLDVSLLDFLRAPSAIEIEVAEQVNLSGGSRLSTHYGNAPIRIRANEIGIDGSRIAFGFSSNAGIDDISIEARSIRLSNGAAISDSEGGERIRIAASDQIRLERSIIGTFASGIPPAQIVIADLGGAEGSLLVDLEGDSEIFTILGGEPSFGQQTIDIQAHTLRLDDSKVRTGSHSGRASFSIHADVARLLLSGGSEISVGGVESQASGGNLAITARDRVSLVGDSKLIATSDGAAGGNISLSGSPLLLVNDSTISAASTGSALTGRPVNGGNVTLGSAEAPLRAVVLRGQSAIDASSSQAEGGNIAIHANAFVVSPDSNLIATGATSNGSVTIDTPRQRGQARSIR